MGSDEATRAEVWCPDCDGSSEPECVDPRRCDGCHGTGTITAPLVPGSKAALKIALAEAAVAHDEAYDAYNRACEDLPRNVNTVEALAEKRWAVQETARALDRAKAALRAVLQKGEGANG